MVVLTPGPVRVDFVWDHEPANPLARARRHSEYQRLMSQHQAHLEWYAGESTPTDPEVINVGARWVRTGAERDLALFGHYARRQVTMVASGRTVKPPALARQPGESREEWLNRRGYTEDMPGTYLMPLNRSHPLWVPATAASAIHSTEIAQLDAYRMWLTTVPDDILLSPQAI